MNFVRTEFPQTIDLSIVVPLYNEEESVAALVQSIDHALREFNAPDTESAVADDGSSQETPAVPLRRQRACEMILVDDGSLDRTVDAALRAASDAEVPIRIISLQRNFGQTAAMQAGIDEARATDRHAGRRPPK